MPAIVARRQWWKSDKYSHAEDYSSNRAANVENSLLLNDVVPAHSAFIFSKTPATQWAVCLNTHLRRICISRYAIYECYKCILCFFCYFVIFVFGVFCEANYWQLKWLKGHSIVNKKRFNSDLIFSSAFATAVPETSQLINVNIINVRQSARRTPTAAQQQQQQQKLDCMETAAWVTLFASFQCSPLMQLLLIVVTIIWQAWKRHLSRTVNLWGQIFVGPRHGLCLERSNPSAAVEVLTLKTCRLVG